MRLLSSFVISLVFFVPVCTASGALEDWFEVSDGGPPVPLEVVEEMSVGLANKVDLSQPNNSQKIKDYFVQYQNPGSGKLINLQGICKSWVQKNPSEYMAKWMLILDGGNCIFRVSYDPVTKQFSGFTFGGR